MTELESRMEICRVGRSLFERGYAHATAGNISMRIDDGYLITPTDACLGFLDPDRLAKVSLTGDQIAGDRASKTLSLHRRIYALAPESRCVIHTHSTSLVACSLKAHEGGNALPEGAELLPPITPYFVMKVGRVPHLPYRRPGSPECADLVEQAIKAYASRGIALRAIMLARLGPNVWHTSPAAAMAVLEELEQTARLWLHSHPPPLDAAAIDELKAAFNVNW